IRLKVEDMSREIKLKRLITGVGGSAINQAQVDAEIAERSRKLPEEMRAKVADTRKVYITPTTFTGWPTVLANTGQPDPVDILGAQLTLWIQQDVIAAVNDANKGA